jgi:hypothetical protein
VQGLEVGANYRLIVDGKDVTPQDLMVTSFGGLTLLFSTESKASDEAVDLPLRLPRALKPITRITHVELRAGDRATSARSQEAQARPANY